MLPRHDERLSRRSQLDTVLGCQGERRARRSSSRRLLAAAGADTTGPNVNKNRSTTSICVDVFWSARVLAIAGRLWNASRRALRGARLRRSRGEVSQGLAPPKVTWRANRKREILDDKSEG